MELINFKFGTNYNDLGRLVLALGQFDGLHLAHISIIKKVIQEAKDNNVKSAIITFYPHPDYVLGKRNNIGYLTPLKDKEQILENLGLDYLIIMPFDEYFSKLLPNEFETKVLDSFHIFKIIVGFDYKYGFKGMGNVDTLKVKYNVNVLDEILFENEKMGSSLVRKFLLAGEIEKATKVLGRFYNITGVVSKGSQFGRTIGVRTANIEIDDEYLELKLGVYGVLVYINGKKYAGVCNVGHNPSFNYVSKPRIETHVFDFNDTLYDNIISVDFLFYIREEIHFEDYELLIKQIQNDIDYAKPILDKYLRG